MEDFASDKAYSAIDKVSIRKGDNLATDNKKDKIKLEKLEDSTRSLAMNKGTLLKIIDELIETEKTKMKTL